MKLSPSPLLWALTGALAFYALSPAPEPIAYPEVVVHRELIERREPPAERTVADRIRTVVVKPEQVATAPGGAVPIVVEFCRGEVERATADLRAASEGEPATGAPPAALAIPGAAERVPATILLRSGSHTPGWFWTADRLTLTGVTSTGDLRQADYRLRPGFSFRASGDSVLVRSPRFWWVREAVEAGAYLGAGYLLGRAVR